MTEDTDAEMTECWDLETENMDAVMTIDGRPCVAKKFLDVIDPATEAVIGNCPDAGDSELDAAIDAGQAALLTGWRTEEARRRQVLSKCGEVIAQERNELARLLTQEQGKPLAEAMGEIELTAEWFQTVANLPLVHQTLHIEGESQVTVRAMPIGVVAAITPWNFPVILAACKVAPALLAGNAVVLKPSPHTPLTTLRIGALLQSALPPGVLNVISGGDTLGIKMCLHPGVRHVSFTGSIVHGKSIAATCADDLKRVTLELGGNDAAIVLNDVDVESVVKRLFWAAFTNAGQFCVAIKRLYVQDAVFEQIVCRLVELARSVRIGHGLIPETQMGPLTTRTQRDHVARLVDDARHDGAEILTGGNAADGPGFFFPPTIVVGADEKTALVREEQFGPALPILRFKDPEEAIKKANATHYGLGASVWTSNVGRGTELACKLEAGTCWVNQHAVFHKLAPFGGAKWSGLGYENGPWGVTQFTQFQVLNVVPPNNAAPTHGAEVDRGHGDGVCSSRRGRRGGS